MTVTTQPSTTAADTSVGEAAEADGDTGRLDDRTVGRVALGLTLVPFVVGVLALFFAVGNQYHSWSDHALIELQTRSVGHDEVLVGLYSRGTWNHPGPALFYVLAPFYWLTGGMSVSISIGALVINGASVAGMALVARRLGGTPLMLVTLLANALLMRALSGEFLQDPWNCFVTTLPFGLLVFLSWAMWRGEFWALPVGAGVFTFLAQTHVGFVALASPLLAWGVVGLVASVVTSRRATAANAVTAADADAADRDPVEPAGGDGDSGAAPSSVGVPGTDRVDTDRVDGDPLTWRRLVRAGVIGAVVLLVGWLPVTYDALTHDPSNLGEVIDYFRHPGEKAHTLVEGWRVMAGQFGGSPEWLVSKQAPAFAGQSPFVNDSPFPWVLLLLVIAGVVLWRRRVTGSVALLNTLGLTFVVGVVAVHRTVGLAFDYRLRWTYIPGLIALVVIGWAGWTLADARWPRAAARLLTPVALAGLALLGGINVYTAATAGTPQNDDSASIASLTDQVLDHLSGYDGLVLVSDQSHSGAWHARGLVLQLEREGYDVGVPDEVGDEYGRHRVLDVTGATGEGEGDGERTDAGQEVIVLHVSRDEYIPVVAARPGMRMIAEWYAGPEDEIAALIDERITLGEDVAAGRISEEEGMERGREITTALADGHQATAFHAAVFLEVPAVAASSAPAPTG
ncbi:MAG TPA: hypothetical protein VFY82_04490 [Acidimicrobiales bacterium]|nr:hypothetical protein [Acidimicrobiales bacterium]